MDPSRHLLARRREGARVRRPCVTALIAGLATLVVAVVPIRMAAAARSAAGPYSVLAVGDTIVSRLFAVRVDTTSGPIAYSETIGRVIETRVDTTLGAAFTFKEAHSRLFEARVDTLFGIPFAYREANSRVFELRHADAYVPWTYHEVHGRAFHAFGQLLPAAVVDVPIIFAFHPPTPNPARGGALLRFDLPVARKVTVDVLDVMGRRVRVLADRAAYAPGRYSLRLEKGRLSSGLYFVRLNAGEFGQTRRLVVLD
jgi:hypothetical protein